MHLDQSMALPPSPTGGLVFGKPSSGGTPASALGDRSFRVTAAFRSFAQVYMYAWRRWRLHILSEGAASQSSSLSLPTPSAMTASTASGDSTPPGLTVSSRIFSSNSLLKAAMNALLTALKPRALQR